MTIDDRARSRHGRRRRCGAVVVALACALALPAASCSGGERSASEVREGRPDPSRGPAPTLAGGLDLGALEPTAVLVGAELAFGEALPSEQAAADAFTDDPEVRAAVARRAYASVDGRHLADVVVLVLDGAQLFDEGVLAAFMRGVVGALGGGEVAEAPLAGRSALLAGDPAAPSAVGFREADLLVVVHGMGDGVLLTATRQLEARARGEVGAPAPTTPLVPLPVDAAFVSVPTVAFAPIPAADDEPGPAPVPPTLPGATALQGRYGVVAGERRTVVWAFTVDPGTYASAESLAPAMVELARARGGAPPSPVELGGRLVLVSVGGTGTPAAQVFRHQGLVLLVEGDRPDQVDAVVTAWIAALGPT